MVPVYMVILAYFFIFIQTLLLVEFCRKMIKSFRYGQIKGHRINGSGRSGMIWLILRVWNLYFGFCRFFLVIYYVVPSRGRDYVLLLGSFLFYAMGEPVFLLLLLTLTLVNHFVGRKIKEQQGGYKMFPLQKD